MPTAVAAIADVPLPYRTPFAVRVVAPVPPLPTGNVPVTWLVRLTPDSVPPSVNEPVLVTVPVSVIPFTVPVPLTLVTVPVVGVVHVGTPAPADVRTCPDVPAAVNAYAVPVP